MKYLGSKKRLTSCRAVPVLLLCLHFMDRDKSDFLGAFANRENRLLASWCLSIRPSVVPSVWDKSAPTGRIFMKFYISVFFRKSVEKNKVLLKSDKNYRYFTWRSFNIYDYLAEFFLEWEMFQIKGVQKIKTHILWSVPFFPEIMRRLWDV